MMLIILLLPAAVGPLTRGPGAKDWRGSGPRPAGLHVSCSRARRGPARGPDFQCPASAHGGTPGARLGSGRQDDAQLPASRPMRDRPSLARIVTVYTWPATAAWIGGPVGSVRRAKAEHTYVYVGRPGVVDSVLRFGPDSDFIIGGHS